MALVDGQSVLACPVVSRTKGATTPRNPLPNEPHNGTLVNPLG
jgi:hypothetical protein